ncbi:MAG: DUF2625 domain-containing protein [Dysgonomonas sp.]
MQILQDLVNTNDPGWPIVKEWIDAAKNKVEILPCSRPRAEIALVNTQVTTRSLMGAIIYETGGILIDRGWIRILGSGSKQMNRSLPEWNKGKTFSEYGAPAPYLLIADDIIGGFYAINGGGLGADAGNIYYNSPDSLEWEALEIDYSQFLLFCFETDMNDFYSNLRWHGWKDEIMDVSPDYGYSFVPFLWTKEGSDINKVSRKVVPIGELYDINLNI